MSEQITWNDLSTPEKRFLNFMVGNNGEYTFYVTDVLKKAAGKDLLTIGKTKGNGTERKALCQITEFGKRLQIEGTYNVPVLVQLVESEPSADSDLAAQLAAAEKRITELEAALKIATDDLTAIFTEHTGDFSAVGVASMALGKIENIMKGTQS